MATSITSNPIPMQNPKTLVDLVEEGHFLKVIQDQDRPNAYHIETDIDHLQLYLADSTYLKDGRPDCMFVHKDSNLGYWATLSLPEARSTSIQYGRLLSLVTMSPQNRVYSSNDLGQNWTEHKIQPPTQGGQLVIVTLNG